MNDLKLNQTCDSVLFICILQRIHVSKTTVIIFLMHMSLKPFIRLITMLIYVYQTTILVLK